MGFSLMQIPKIPIEFGVMLSTMNFVICFTGYYSGDDKPTSVGICAVVFGAMTIIGILLLPNKK